MTSEERLIPPRSTTKMTIEETSNRDSHGNLQRTADKERGLVGNAGSSLSPLVRTLVILFIIFVFFLAIALNSALQVQSASTNPLTVIIPDVVLFFAMVISPILVLHFIDFCHDQWVKYGRPPTVFEKFPNLRRFSWAEMETWTNHFSEDRKIGQGGFGIVYLAHIPGNLPGLPADGILGAAKVEIDSVARKAVDDDFLGEVSILARAHHIALVPLLGVCSDPGHPRILVFEFMPHGNLYSRLHEFDAERAEILSWKERLTIASHVASGLHYLHEAATPPIVHQDVKSSNVLLREDNSAVISDFGISKIANVLDTSFQTKITNDIRGSEGYIDPHFVNTGESSTKNDVYSFGVLLLELITGRKAVVISSKGRTLLVDYFAEQIANPDRITEVADPKLGLSISNNNNNNEGFHKFPVDFSELSSGATGAEQGIRMNPTYHYAVLDEVKRAGALVKDCVQVGDEGRRRRPSMREVLNRLKDVSPSYTTNVY